MTRIPTRVDDPALVDRRRAQLTAAAIACFSEHGYHASTIRDIAERAEVSVGLIYQYVKDKEDLLFLALQEVLDSYQRQIPQALAGVSEPLARFCAAVGGYCLVNDRAAAATVLAYRETKSLRKERRDIIKQMEIETNQIIAACIRDCIAAGLFAEVDIELFTYQIVMFCHAWALKAWRFASAMSVEAYVERGLRLMLGGVLTAEGARRMAAAPRPTAAPRDAG